VVKSSSTSVDGARRSVDHPSLGVQLLETAPSRSSTSSSSSALTGRFPRALLVGGAITSKRVMWRGRAKYPREFLSRDRDRDYESRGRVPVRPSMAMAAQPRANPALVVQPTVPPPTNLGGPPPDIASLESIKSRVNQLIESIQTLASLLEIYHPPPPWPDLLAKYAVVMAQTHNLSRALASSALPNTALHPRLPLLDAPLDGALIPLLRNQQTTDVLRAESASVRRLSTALKLPEDPPPHAVLDVVAEVVAAHDARADRAQRAVAMLREKYDWRVRVAVDPDEVWGDDGEDMDGLGLGEAPAAQKVPDSPASANTSEEEEELENVLGNGLANSDQEHEDVHMAEG